MVMAQDIHSHICYLDYFQTTIILFSKAAKHLGKRIEEKKHVFISTVGWLCKQIKV